MEQPLEAAVAAHYANPGLATRILAGLARTGVDIERLAPADLAAVDEFHTAGRATTLMALERTPITAGMHVLDAGCGLGGTARHLAAERGCRVTGIDLTPDFIEVGSLLNQMTGLAEKVSLQVGSVLDLPFPDASFDAAISFHVAMNIDDRALLYRELARVLPEAAPLCLFDVMQGRNRGMHYPVPWSETGATSFLRTRAQTRAALEEAGFAVTVEESLREFAIDFFRAMFARAAADGQPPPLGLHLLTGANTKDKFKNYFRGLEEHRVEPVIVVAERR